jgi:hypothetical protein
MLCFLPPSFVTDFLNFCFYFGNFDVMVTHLPTGTTCPTAPTLLRILIILALEAEGDAEGVIGPEKPVLVGSALSVLPWAENPAIPAPASVQEALKIRGDISDIGKM